MPEITSRLSTALAGRYRIERHLGEGGMATVYLAEDLKHKRKVALKVLKPDLAAVLGAERFIQEITTTASLQHPHILPLFDSGEADSFLYYVMPFIDGETLRDRLDRETQLSIDDAVRITTEVADALDYAHRNNVIHRDIKPENILLHDGRPMVADFGIALAVSAAAGGRMTETGMSLGTPHYMSPEQATAEHDPTNRSDIYALGCVLYEMLTGNPPHVGASVQQIIMKIVTEEAAPVASLRKSVPANVVAAVDHALQKLPADRFESAKAFADALGNPAFTTSITQASAVSDARPSSPWNRLTIGLTVALALMALVTIWQFTRPQPPRPVSRYSVRLAEGQGISSVLSRIALSPDGSRLVYVGEGSGGGGRGGTQLWVRARDQLEATPLQGTNGALSPFFSPDGDRVGFLRAGVRIVSLRGGPPVLVTDTMVGNAGGTWGPDGFIYADAEGASALVRVRAAGGAPEWFTTLDSASGETDHIYPDALPNGRGVIFSIRRGSAAGANIGVAEAATGEHRVVLAGVHARYAASGHILYVTIDGTLMAVPFDEDALELRGEPSALVNGLGLRNIAVPDLAISANGTLAYTTGGASDAGEPVWVDRDGRTEPVAAGWTSRVSSLALSPDGTQLSVAIDDGDQQVWVRQLALGTASKLTFQGSRNDRPAWTPDGRSVAFVSGRMPILSLFQRRADGTAAAEVLHQSDDQLQEVQFTLDGEWIVFRRGGGPAGDIYARQLTGDAAEVPLVATEFQESSPTVSPDGRWLAYVSNETGEFQVYVRPFPNVDDGRWLVSTSGGTEPVWARDGSELFHRNGNGDMIAVDVLPGDAFTMGAQRVLFSATQYRVSEFHQNYDVTPDGQRFVMIRTRGTQSDLELIVVENFFEELKAKVGN